MRCTDPQIATQGHFQTAAHTDAINRRDRRYRKILKLLSEALNDGLVNRAVATTPARFPALSACVRMEGISLPCCDSQSFSSVLELAEITPLLVFSPHNIAVAVAAESEVWKSTAYV